MRVAGMVLPTHGFRQSNTNWVPLGDSGRPSLTDKVFTGRCGKPLSARTAARWIADGITNAGLQAAATGTGAKGPASHSLRHSCARHWLQSGLNVNAVSAWLGHSSPTVTLNIYLVLAPDTPGDISEVP